MQNFPSRALLVGLPAAPASAVPSELPEATGDTLSMSQLSEVFEVGDRVVYIGFRRRIYGTVIAFKLESEKNGGKAGEVRVYAFTTDDGGSATKPGYYPQYAE